MGIVLKFLVVFLVGFFVCGLYMNSFKSYFVCSCVVFLIILLAVKDSSISLRMSIELSIYELGLLFVLKPVENENRFVDEIEEKIFWIGLDGLWE